MILVEVNIYIVLDQVDLRSLKVCFSYLISLCLLGKENSRQSVVIEALLALSHYVLYNLNGSDTAT